MKPARIAPPGARQLLARILDTPELVSAVRALPPRALGRLIDHVGLEDAGELVALATTEQLERIFDEDLWKSAAPGRDEVFDGERFGLWLEVMLEAGERFAARKLTELPDELVMLALARQILVIDLDTLAVNMSQMSDEARDEEELVDKALDGVLHEELGQYRVISRRPAGWDAVLAVLLALDQEHHEYLERLLERCAAASVEAIEDAGGLYTVLTSAEMLESDAAAEREDRRAAEGFIAPSQASSFLALARATPLAKARERDPVTRAYFREWAAPAAAAAAPPEAAPAPAATRLVELLREAEVVETPRPVALLGGRAAAPEAAFQRALAALPPALHETRMKELGYLTNVLVAGASLENKSPRPFEAAEMVLAACCLGLAELPGAALERDGADVLFRAGWHVLHSEVAMPALRALERVLGQLRGLDARQAAVLARASAAVKSALAVERPWTVRSRLGAVLDETTRAGLEALLGECPTLPGGTRIASTAQVREARRWLDAL